MSNPDKEPRKSCFESALSFGVFSVCASTGLYIFVGTLAWASIPETSITAEQLSTGLIGGAIIIFLSLGILKDWYDNGSL